MAAQEGKKNATHWKVPARQLSTFEARENYITLDCGWKGETRIRYPASYCERILRSKFESQKWFIASKRNGESQHVVVVVGTKEGKDEVMAAHEKIMDEVRQPPTVKYWITGVAALHTEDLKQVMGMYGVVQFVKRFGCAQNDTNAEWGYSALVGISQKGDIKVRLPDEVGYVVDGIEWSMFVGLAKKQQQGQNLGARIPARNLQWAKQDEKKAEVGKVPNPGNGDGFGQDLQAPGTEGLDKKEKPVQVSILKRTKPANEQQEANMGSEGDLPAIDQNQGNAQAQKTKEKGTHQRTPPGNQPGMLGKTKMLFYPVEEILPLLRWWHVAAVVVAHRHLLCVVGIRRHDAMVWARLWILWLLLLTPIWEQSKKQPVARRRGNRKRNRKEQPLQLPARKKVNHRESVEKLSYIRKPQRNLHREKSRQEGHAADLIHLQKVVAHGPRVCSGQAKILSNH